jgi:hypothetical protein
MKRFLIMLTMLAVATGNSQTTIFQENWDGQGPGISAWTLYNLDGLTPVGPNGDDGEDLSFLVQNAWNVLTFAQIEPVNSNDMSGYGIGATGMAGNVVVSNSWYNPVGTANDWLVSPQITIPAGVSEVSLNWAAQSFGDSNSLEDYQVYVSPNGGGAVANFTTLLLDVDSESNDGNYRTLSLLPYVGKTIRIAFRDNTVNKFLLFLDNISVTTGNSLSVDDIIVSSKFTISPIPVKSMLSVSNTEKINVNAISIADLNGRVIKENKYNNIDNIQVDLSELSSGMYIMNINSDQGIATKKIVKE